MDIPLLTVVTGSSWSNTNAFGIIGGPSRPSLSRPVNVRLLIVQACKQLTAAKKSPDGYHELGTLLRQIDQIRPASEPAVQMAEMLEICETEGDAQNGGGFFSIKSEGPSMAAPGLIGQGSSTPGLAQGVAQGMGRTFVRYEPGGNTAGLGARGGSIAPGEIGSPVPSASMPSFGAPHAQQHHQHPQHQHHPPGVPSHQQLPHHHFTGSSNSVVSPSGF